MSITSHEFVFQSLLKVLKLDLLLFVLLAGCLMAVGHDSLGQKLLIVQAVVVVRAGYGFVG